MTWIETNLSEQYAVILPAGQKVQALFYYLFISLNDSEAWACAVLKSEVTIWSRDVWSGKICLQHSSVLLQL